MNYGFIIDNRRCIGCHACTVACKAEHETPIGVNRTWVKYIERGRFPNTRRHFSVMRCNHCSDAPCVEICPVTALFHRPDGIVDFDNRRCIGCKACTQACPYDAIYIDPESRTAAKCNYCAHRVEVALEPACVNVCPETAIISGDLDDPESKISRLLAREQVTVRKPEKASPKLFYIEGDEVSLSPQLALPEKDYFWNSQERGVGHYARYADRRLESNDGEERSDPDWLEEGEERVLVPEAEGKAELEQKAREVLKEQTRRVYDAPAKGVLWGWEVPAYMWTKSVSVGLFLVWYVFGSWSDIQILGGSTVLTPSLTLIICLFFLAFTGALLVKDLDRPERFLYVLLRPQWNSWLVRGAYIVAVYGLLLAGLLVCEITNNQTIKNYLLWPAVIFALLTAVYTAFLLAQAKGRDFWQSPLLAVHMLVHAILAGAGICALVLALTGPYVASNENIGWFPSLGPPLWVGFLTWVMMPGIILQLATIFLEIATPHSTDDAKKTVELITRGQFSALFWWGGIMVGNVIPLTLLLVAEPLLAVIFSGVSGILVLTGVYVIQHIWVRAPQLIPLS